MNIYFNVQGSPNGGGPSVFVYKFANALIRKGHKVNYDKPNRADVCFLIIESGKVLRQINREKTKTILRLDGIYCEEYNMLFNRKKTPDMIALHNKLKSDINSVDFVVYQSNWSKERADEEIVKRKDERWKIIHNGVDLSLFRPIKRKKDGFFNLLNVGMLRDEYIGRTLIGVYRELAKRGRKVRMLLAGKPDAYISKIINENKNDPNFVFLGSAPNNKINQIYNSGDIFLAVRQGSSSDNVVAEAQACGLPVIIPSWGGNVDMVKDGFGGKIVKTGHWTYNSEYIYDIANATEGIMDDYDEFGKRARRYAEEFLGIDKLVEKYMRIIQT